MAMPRDATSLDNTLILTLKRCIVVYLLCLFGVVKVNSQCKNLFCVEIVYWSQESTNPSLPCHYVPVWGDVQNASNTEKGSELSLKTNRTAFIFLLLVK